jgi:stress response protein YsnF
VEVGKEVQSAPQVRTEGDTTIISIVEEMLVVEKRLFVKEEIHIRRKSSKESIEVPVTLRKQRVVVERELSIGAQF